MQQDTPTPSSPTVLRRLWQSLPGKILIVSIGLVTLCCGGTFAAALVDVGMREVGVWPTYTPTPTITATPNPPTATATTNPPTATATASPPTATSNPPTATATSNPPTATATPNPPTATTAPPTQPPAPTKAPTIAPVRNYVGTGVWRCPTDTTGAAYVGSAGQDKFHKLSCPSAGQIADHNRLCFESRDAAVAFNYIPCGRCRP